MKKLFAALLVLFLLAPAAIADDIDLSSLSFEELAALRDRIQLEMMQRDEWQQVTVPQGVYKVGEDIPAGTWTIRCADTGRDSIILRNTEITVGTKLNETKTDVSWDSDFWTYESIYNPNNKYYGGEKSEITITLKNGQYVSITSNRAVFTPYTGKPSLGFK